MDYYRIMAITDDNTAEEIINEIKEREQERNRLIAVCEDQITKYQNKIEELKTKHDEWASYPTVLLAEYCRLNANHKTKTTMSYALPSGVLRWKKKDAKIVRDERALLAWTLENFPNLVRIKQEPDWSVIKSKAVAVGDHYEMPTIEGEMIPIDGVTLVDGGEVFELKTEVAG